MYFYTYVLKSAKDNGLHIGWTNKLKRRLQAHNDGLVAATKYRLSLKLVYFEGCLSKEDAVCREKQLKTGFGRAYLKRRFG